MLVYDVVYDRHTPEDCPVADGTVPISYLELSLALENSLPGYPWSLSFWQRPTSNLTVLCFLRCASWPRVAFQGHSRPRTLRLHYYRR